MSDLTENDILERHKQALGEARRACQQLGRNADPLYLAPRGRHYTELKKALALLEGSARQMAHWRDDGRWLRLGIVYAKAMRGAQQKFVGQRWAWFGELQALFVLGERRLDELNQRTGTLGAILPQRASEWLVLPDSRPALRRPGSLH